MNDYQTVAAVIKHIVEHKLELQSLEEIATSFGVSPGHLQKVFTRWVAVSPKQFARYLSLQHAKAELAAGASTGQATLGAGLSSGGRLHDLFVDIEAMTPGEYQHGTLTLHYSIAPSPFGYCLIASTERGVCNILFADNETAALTDLTSRWPSATLTNEPGLSWHKTVRDFLNGVEPERKIKLHLHGTNFQLKVWEALLSIPEGKLATYGQIAADIGEPTAARAVGSMVGDNPVGYLIPCHRVLKSTGQISGYHWGIERKRSMLLREALITH